MFVQVTLELLVGFWENLKVFLLTLAFSLPLGLVASFSLCTLASLSSRLGAHDVPLSCSPVWVQVAFSGSTVSCAGIICLVLNFQEFFHKFFRLISASVVKTVWRWGFMYGNSV